MKLKKLYCSEISKNVFRIYSVVTVIYSILVFLAYPLYVITNGRENVEHILYNPMLIGLTVIIPIFLGLVYNFLYSTRSINEVHGLPYTRTQIYMNYLLAGFALLIIPYVVNGVVLFILKAITSDMIQLSYGEILYTLAIFIMMNLVLFCFSSFIAVLVSSSFMHIGLSYFILLMPSILVIVLMNAVLSQLIYGFPSFIMSGKMTLKVLQLSPILFPINSGVNESNLYSTWLLIYYGCFGIGSILLSLVFYNRRKLEKVNEWVAFNWVKIVIKVLFASMGAVFIGGLFIAIQSKAYISTIIWFLIGATVGYVIATMFLNKTIRVFKHWKGLAAYLVVLVAIYAVIAFDLTGYVGKIPDSDDIVTIDINSGITAELDAKRETQITDAKSIDQITKIHQTIVDYYKSNSKEAINTNNWSTKFAITYQLKNGRSLVREYFVPKDIYYEVSGMLLECTEIADLNLAEQVDKNRIIAAELYSRKGNAFLESEELKEFIAVLERDYKNMTLEQRLSSNESISISLIYHENYENNNKDYFNISVGSYHVMTLDWLEKKGYLGQLMYDAEEVNRIELYLDGRMIKEITDNEEFKYYLDHYKSYNLFFEEEYIEVHVYLKNGVTMYGYMKKDDVK